VLLYDNTIRSSPCGAACRMLHFMTLLTRINASSAVMSAAVVVALMARSSNAALSLDTMLTESGEEADGGVPDNGARVTTALVPSTGSAYDPATTALLWVHVPKCGGTALARLAHAAAVAHSQKIAWCYNRGDAMTP
jgi:hypothetical protein